MNVLYGLCGEGLGHAMRGLALIDQIPECRFHLFTYGKAHSFLEKNTPSNVHLHKIDGQMFSYSGGKVNYLKTLWNNKGLILSNFRKSIKKITDVADMVEPTLCISDLEPSVARASIKLGLNCVSIDNQHRFSHCHNKLPSAFLRLYGWGLGSYSRWLIPHPTRILISCFHYDISHAIKKMDGRPLLIPPMVRKSIEETIPTDTYSGYTLVYLRESIQNQVISAMSEIKNEVRIYGANLDTVDRKFRDKPNFRFFELSSEFPKVLAGCGHVIATAGNQLISECRFYRKPILAIPEPAQYEQVINAHFVDEIGLGVTCDAKNLSTKVVNKFVGDFRVKSEPAPNGAITAAKIVRSYL